MSIYCKQVLTAWQLLQERELAWPGLHHAKDLPQLQNAEEEKVSLHHLSADQGPADQKSKNTEQGLLFFYWQLLKIAADNFPQTVAYQFHLCKPYTTWLGTILHGWAGEL